VNHSRSKDFFSDLGRAQTPLGWKAGIALDPAELVFPAAGTADLPRMASKFCLGDTHALGVSMIISGLTRLFSLAVRKLARAA
jgi:hypothetical protein